MVMASLLPSAFASENTTQGVAAGSKFKVGVSDPDPATLVEQGATIPSADDEDASWLYCDPRVECYLDSGIVVHRRLPSVDNAPDSLGSADMNDADFATLSGLGVNLKSNDRYADVVQRMGHSVYRFHLCGEAVRVRHQVPIPRLLTVGGVPAIPDDDRPQVAYNKIAGNLSGIIMWYAEWSLWYTVSVPPTQALAVPPQNPAEHIAGDDKPPPDGMQAPWSQPDEEAQPSDPRIGGGNLLNGLQG